MPEEITPQGPELIPQRNDQRNERHHLDSAISQALRLYQNVVISSYGGPKETFNKFAQVIRVIPDADLLLVLEDQLIELADFVRKFNDILDQTQKIEGISSEQRQSIVDNITKSADSLYRESIRHFANAIALGAVRTQVSVKNLELQLNVKTQEHEQATGAILKDMKARDDESKKLLQNLALGAHASYFKTQAGKHETASWVWLGASFVIACLTLLFGWYSYEHYVGTITTMTIQQSIQFALSKVVFLSILFSALVWCGKSYRAQQHNYVVNVHRQNALSTFQAFVQANTDEPTKNAVLLQATQCIFSSQPSGYITQEGDTVGTTQILEIFRGLGGGQTKSP